MPSIEQFREFLVLSEFLNFSAAAESLFITQPALSRHIAALERELDCRLFDRDTQSVSLTVAGKIFREQAAAIVGGYEDVCSRLRILKSGFSSRLRISYPVYAMHDFLGPVPEMFERSHPGVKLQYSIGDPNEAMLALTGGTADLAIVPKYAMPGCAKLCSRKIYTERLGVLLNRSHPLAEKEELSLEELRNETFFSVDNNYFRAAWRHVFSLCRKAGFSPAPPVLFNQMEALIMAVRRGDGIAVLGRHMRNQQSKLIVFRPLKGGDCVRDVCMWYRPDEPNEAIGQFIDFYLATPFERD